MDRRLGNSNSRLMALAYVAAALAATQLPAQQPWPPPQPVAAPTRPVVQQAAYLSAVQPSPPGVPGAPPVYAPPTNAEMLPPAMLPGYGGSPVPGAGSAWTLEQVETATLEFNPALRGSFARIEAARGQAQQASLYPNPRMDSNNPEVFAGPNSSYNFGFMQDIVVKGKLRLDRAAANEVLRQRQHGLTVDRFMLLLAVRQQFYTVLAAQRRVEVLDEIRRNYMNSVQTADNRRQGGIGTTLEVLLLKTQLQRAEVALVNAQTMLEADRRQLAAIMGRPDIRIDLAVGDLTSGFPAFDANILRQFVVMENAQVQIARREIERNEFLLRRARVEPYPNVRVGPAYSSNLLSSPGSQQFWLTLQFDIPVWNRNQGNIVAAQASLVESIASLGVVQNDLLSQAENALGRYLAARQMEEKVRDEILPTSRESVRLTQLAYQAGEFDISALLQSQRTLSEALLSYVDTLETLWMTAAEISKLLQLERFP